MDDLAAATDVAASAPLCVAYSSSSYLGARVGIARNNCPYTVRVRFIWRMGSDSTCRTLTPGAVTTDWVNRLFKALLLEDSESVEDPWQGLTLEEIAMLEHEDGTDKELADAEGGAPDDFSLATTPIEALAPGCVRISQWNGPWVSWATVSNNCGYRVRVKLIFAWGLDTGCIHLEPGWKATRGVGTPAAYVKRIETC